MSLVNDELLFSVINSADMSQVLDYCKEHSSEETYQSVVNSMKRTGTTILLFFVAWIAVVIIGFGVSMIGPDIGIDWIMVICLVAPCIILIWFKFWSRRSTSRFNPMREWVLYYKWYREKTEVDGWYDPENQAM